MRRSSSDWLTIVGQLRSAVSGLLDLIRCYVQQATVPVGRDV